MYKLFRQYCTGFICLLFGSFIHAETIELGMSTALSGPTQFTGKAMLDGMNTFFGAVNRQGGIHGRRINLTVLDDGYEIDSVTANIDTLIHQHQVKAIVGNVGTPSAVIAAPMANAHGVVLYGAYTGADILRNVPPDPYVFNFRASYRQEMALIVEDIIARGISPRRIAFFLQDDAFGSTGYEMALAALGKQRFHQFDQLLVTHYPRNSLAVQAAVTRMIRTKPAPEAIIMVGTYKPIGQFVRFLHRVFPDTLFYCLSFTGAPLLAEALEVDAVYGRILMTQVVPPQVSKAEADTDEHNVIWREGYLAAQVLVQALHDIKGDINGETIKKALETLGIFNLEDFGLLSMSPEDHQASDHVWLTQLDQFFQWQVVRTNGAGD